MHFRTHFSVFIYGWVQGRISLHKAYMHAIKQFLNDHAKEMLCDVDRRFKKVFQGYITCWEEKPFGS